jgi:hypothetical protein
MLEKLRTQRSPSAAQDNRRETFLRPGRDFSRTKPGIIPSGRNQRIKGGPTMSDRERSGGGENIKEKVSDDFDTGRKEKDREREGGGAEDVKEKVQDDFESSRKSE